MNTTDDYQPATIEELLEGTMAQPRPIYSAKLRQLVLEMGEESRKMGRFDATGQETPDDMYGLQVEVWDRFKAQLNAEGFEEVPHVTSLYFRACYAEGRDSSAVKD